MSLFCLRSQWSWPWLKSTAGLQPRSEPSPANRAQPGTAAFEGLQRGAHARARLPRRREEREPGRAEADPEPTHEAARRLRQNPPPPLPAAQLRAPQWELPPSPLCSVSCSSFSSSSVSSSSGPQSGRSAPFTVSAPRPRPPRAAAGRGPPARPAPPHSGGAGSGMSRPARVAESDQGAGEGTRCAVAAGPPSCAGLGGGGIPARRRGRLGAAGLDRAGRRGRLLRLLLRLLLTSQGPYACLSAPSLILAFLSGASSLWSSIRFVLMFGGDPSYNSSPGSLPS